MSDADIYAILGRIKGARMPLYFTLAKHPQLQRFTPSQRLKIFALAYLNVNGWTRLAVNLYKLCLLIPPFVWLANVDVWWHGLPMLLAIPLYPLLVRPMQVWAVRNYLAATIAQAESDQGRVNN